MLNLSIITACIPSLKRFLQDLQSGAMAVNITEAFEMSGASSKKVSLAQGGRGGGPYAAMSRTTNNSNFASRTASKLGVKRHPKSKIQTSTAATTTTGYNRDDDDHTADLKRGYEVGDGHSFAQGHNDNPHKFSTQRSTVERSDSVKGLTDGVIYRSVDFKVEYEGRSSEGSGSRPSPPHDDTAWYDTRNEEGDAISTYDIRK